MDTNNISDLTIVYEPIDSLVNYPSNARKHSKHQVRQIEASIRTFGFTNPVLIDRKRTIIAGHGRVEAARLLGLREVPTIRLENLTEGQVRAYVIADNRLAEKAGWEKSILAIELQNLMVDDANVDVTVTGFEVPEIDLILEEANDQKQDEDDVFQIDEANQIVTQSGDLWLLGKHRVLCDNSLDQNSYRSLMASRHASVVFLDVPYNIKIAGNVSGKGLIRHRNFKMAVGEMSREEFITFLTSSLRLAAQASTEGSIHFVCMDWRHMAELLAAGEVVHDDLLNVCVWAKDKGGQGSFYRSAHELVFVYRNGKTRHRNNIQLGRYGRYRTNVWNYPSAGTLSRQSDEGNLLALHPTVKPVALVADALLDCSARGEIVLDSYLGSGSTLIAAERVGRVCCGIEIDPHYVDVAIRRWQRHTGGQAIHAITRKSFDETAAVSGAQNGE